LTERTTTAGRETARLAVDAALGALGARIAERAAAIIEDLEMLHRTIEEARPLAHTVETFEALEEADTRIWEALDGLRDVLGRTGFLVAGAQRVAR
jgi:hypothetical protein